MTIKETITMAVIERELQKFGIEIKSGNSYRPFNDVVIDISNRWKTMNDDQRQTIKNMLLGIK